MYNDLSFDEQRLLSEYRAMTEVERYKVQSWIGTRNDQLLFWFETVANDGQYSPRIAVTIREYQPLLVR